MYTYYINFNNSDEEILKKRGIWRKYKKGDKKIDFVYVDRWQNFDKNFFYNLEIKIENFAIVLKGRNKREIVDLFLKDPKTRKYVPNQISFDPNNIKEEVLNFIKKGKIYIAKPISGARGENIEMILNKKDFINNIPNFKKSFFRRDKKIKDGKNWVLQEYIKNILLYRNKKFHIRIYIIMTNEGENFLLKHFFILSAEKEYKLKDYKNKKIHDSHYIPGDLIEITDKNIDLFTKEEYRIIKKNIIKISKLFIKKAEIKCYDLGNCFFLFGLDIMFLEDFSPILIEANITPAANEHDIIFEGVVQEIIDKKFPPKFKPKEEKRFIKL